ncbi:MAG: restriction endonuclease subunit S [Betaproteobacteria bacterium]|nr:restriction endonuclease subunit S [Betaproteobacteria bacterium]
MSAYRNIEFLRVIDEWETALIGRENVPLLLLMRNGLTVDQNKEHGEFRVTRIETISDGYINNKRIRFVSGINKENVDKYRIRKGDILFSHINSDPHLGKTALAQKDYTDLLHGMNLLLLRTNPNVLMPDFFHFICCYYRIKGVFAKICSRSVNQSSINQAKLKALEIPLPPLLEQQKISAVLGLVQQAIEQQEKLLALTTELKKTLLHQLFTHGLRNEPQKQTEIGLIPESWEVRPLGDYLTEAQYGLSSKGAETGSYALLRMTNQQQGQITAEKLQYVELTAKEFEKFRLKRQDILFNRTNSLELVGRTAIFELDGDYVFASYLIRLRADTERLRPHFLNHYLNADETQFRLKSIATRAVSQSNISATRLRGFLVPVPSTGEQDEIVRMIAGVDRKLKIHRRKHDALSDLFRTLLHELMTAKIRVHNLTFSGLEKINE